MSNMKYKHFDGYSIVELEGDFIGGDEINKLRDELKEFAQKESGNNLIADLSNVTYLNSTALGIFLSANAFFEKNNGKLLLCNANSYLKNIFSITKLDIIFEIYGSAEEAIKKLNK